MSSFLSVEEDGVKSYIAAESAEDDLIQYFIDRAETEFQDLTGRQIVQKIVEKDFEIESPTQTIFTRESPTEWGTGCELLIDGEVFDTANFALKSWGRIVRIDDGVFTAGQKIDLKILAGWTDESRPADIKLGLLDRIKQLWLSHQTDLEDDTRVASKSIGDIKITYQSKGVPKAVIWENMVKQYTLL